MENVEEIQQWGPLNKKGYPIKEKQGEEYQKFIRCMQSLGYISDSRELVAADYGAPTTRKRWYAVFRRDGRDIVWPESTHGKGGLNGLLPWEAIYKQLELTNLGKSIFGRKTPLAEKTMNRIARGLEKFVFNSPEPFIVQVNHGGDNFRGQSINVPLSTVTQKHGFGVVTPLLIQYHSETTKGRGQNLTEPIHTITTSPEHFGTVSVLTMDWKELQEAGIDEETAQKCTWVSQFVMTYYGCGTGQDLRMPINTIMAKDRFALVTVLEREYVILDIFLRMLTEEELKLGQGFPEDYIIDRDYLWHVYPAAERVKRIGNSVVPIMAQKLVEANCSYLKAGERIRNMMIDDSSPQLRFA